jgi:hypothetical protein
MDKNEYKKFADKMVDWFSVPEHYSVVHFAIEHGISKQRLIRMGDEDEYFKEKLEYAFSVMEYKVTEGALSGALDKSVSTKLLETYHGFKSDISVYQKVEQTMSPELAEKLVEAIDKIEGMDGVGRGFKDGFGEVKVSSAGMNSGFGSNDNSGGVLDTDLEIKNGKKSNKG